MKEKQIALYARVSSEQQAEAKTIEGQLAEVRASIAADGFDLQTILEFVDEGYSGSTLIGLLVTTPTKSCCLKN